MHAVSTLPARSKFSEVANMLHANADRVFLVNGLTLSGATMLRKKEISVAQRKNSSGVREFYAQSERNSSGTHSSPDHLAALGLVEVDSIPSRSKYEYVVLGAKAQPGVLYQLDEVPISAATELRKHGLHVSQRAVNGSATLFVRYPG